MEEGENGVRLIHIFNTSDLLFWEMMRRRVRFLSAAKPTDQGEESIVLLVVVVGGGHFQMSHVQFF